MSTSVSRQTNAKPSLRCLPFVAGVLFAVLSLPATAGLATSERITYQGRLLDNGTPFTGTVDMAFGLWTQQSGGTLIQTDTKSGVEVANGLFQVELFFGEEAYEDSLWIEVVADGTTLTPRQPITAVPLALHALNGGGGGFWELVGSTLSYDGPVEIATNAGEALVVTGDNTGIRAQASNLAVSGITGGGTAIRGVATNDTGENNGIRGTSFSQSGAGVRADNVHPFGTAIVAESYVGLFADAEAIGVITTGEVAGVSASSPFQAVFGSATASEGYGAYFVGQPGSSNYFQQKVGIGTLDPTATLEINGPAVGQPPAALKVSVNDDQKFVVGSLGMSIFQNVFLDGLLALTTLQTGGSVDLCITGSVAFPGQVATCSSSARYKTDIESIESATALVDQLRPVTFRWTETGEADYGFVAEEVAEIEPRLTTYNVEGQIEGVKYRQISALLLRALQEQRQDHQREIQRLDDELQVLSVRLDRSQELEQENRLLTGRLDRLESMLFGDSSVASDR